VRGKITPYKAKDLVPIVRNAIAKNPSLSNNDMESMLAPYGKIVKSDKKKTTVFTDSLLQNTWSEARKEVFGDAKSNATYATALKAELEKRGHHVHLSLVNRNHTLKNILNVVWDNWKARNPTTNESRKPFCEHWVEENSDQLYLDIRDITDNYLFVTECFFSPSTAKATVPKLQHVFQADAAHTAFSK